MWVGKIDFFLVWRKQLTTIATHRRKKWGKKRQYVQVQSCSMMSEDASSPQPEYIICLEKMTNDNIAQIKLETHLETKDSFPKRS